MRLNQWIQVFRTRVKRKEKPQDEPTGTDVKPDRAERKIAAYECLRSANFNQKLAAQSLRV